MDLSNYLKDSPLHSMINHRKPFFFKDEMKGLVIAFFCGLRSKLYMVGMENEENLFRMAGLPAVAAKLCECVPYLSAILHRREFSTAFTSLQSSRHSIHLTRLVKKSLSTFDPKVKVSPCALHSSFYGDDSKKCICPDPDASNDNLCVADNNILII